MIKTEIKDYQSKCPIRHKIVLLKRNILTTFFNVWYRYREPEMVSWWKRSASIRAKVTQDTKGHYVMFMEGEKYPFPGVPRGHLLFGSLSLLKHQIKNQVFNFAFKNKSITGIRGKVLDRIVAIATNLRHDFIPKQKMVPAVKEVYRALTSVEQYIRPDKRQKMEMLKEIICYILQEDDGYRFRVQWMMSYLNKKHPLETFLFGLDMMKEAEVIDDMKDRVVLWRTVLKMLLEDEVIQNLFKLFIVEINIKRVKLNKYDKYYFRAKYFKVDYDKYDY